MPLRVGWIKFDAVPDKHVHDEYGRHAHDLRSEHDTHAYDDGYLVIDRHLYDD